MTAKLMLEHPSWLLAAEDQHLPEGQRSMWYQGHRSLAPSQYPLQWSTPHSCKSAWRAPPPSILAYAMNAWHSPQKRLPDAGWHELHLWSEGYCLGRTHRGASLGATGCQRRGTWCAQSLRCTLHHSCITTNILCHSTLRKMPFTCIDKFLVKAPGIIRPCLVNRS